MITRIVSKNFDIPNSHKLEVALKNGRYSSIDKLFTMTPDEVTAEVTKSGLRGKGAGGAACGPKWELMPPVDERPRYLIVNGDESEPLKASAAFLRDLRMKTMPVRHPGTEPLMRSALSSARTWTTSRFVA